VALLVTHYILAYGYFRSVIQTLNDEVGEAVTVDSRLEMQCDANDSLNHSFRDLAFINAQLQMARSDSAGFVIDIPDSLVSVQIKGVNVYSTRIKAYQLDFILQNAGVQAYQHLYAKPLNIRSEQSNIEKEPILHVIAPEDTASARVAPKQQPDTTLAIVVKVDYLLDHNIDLTLKGYEKPSFSRWMTDQFQFVGERIMLTRNMFSNVFSDQAPDYKYKLHIEVGNSDARVINHALQSDAWVCIRH
jgi:hypothetical protein